MPRRDDAPRDLLFGLLALQNGMVTRDQLVMAFTVWTAAPGRPLADILAEQGALRPEHRPLLDALAEAHLKLHGGDPEKSLAALELNRSTRESLAGAGGPEVEATLAYVGGGSGVDGDADRTSTYAVGSATSDGQRFRVLRPHARGGLGAVFVALDSELNREVALKQILEHHADDPASRTRFLVEAEITGGLEHPGIVPVYGLGTYADGRPYYAMRFVRGDSLKEAIGHFHGAPAGPALQTDPTASPAPKTVRTADPTTRALGLRRLLRRFLDVCNAIEYAHSRGVLHRDMKPGNIIVGKHGETLVVDWGVAKPMGKVEPGHDSGERMLVPSSASGSAETLPGSALGTPAYMSPEQAAGDLDKLGPRSDVYSLGATLYCLLTGRPPFGGDVGEVLGKVRKGEFPPPRQLDPSIDRALEAVCLKAMATRPEDRYASGRALAEDVERWMADESVAAWREPWTRTLVRWLTRHRTGVTGAAAAGLAGAVGLVAVLAVQASANASLTASLVRETRAKNDLAAANAELTRSKAAVQARYDLAVDAIKTFHTGVSEDFLLTQDQFRGLRDALLKSAADFYGKLSALLGQETDFTSRRALARSNFELADLTGKVGTKDDALKAHRAALAAREALAAEPGSGPALAADLADSLAAVGLVLEETGKTSEALAAYERARRAVASSDGAPPADGAARSAFATALFREGSLLYTVGRDAEGLKALERARDLQSALAAAAPGDNDRRSALAASHNNIGRLLNQTGRPAEALREFEAARAIREGLTRNNPAVTRFRSDLARTHNNIGVLLSQTGQPAEALRSHEAARAIREGLARANPAVTQFRADLARSHNDIGNLLSVTGRPAEAEAEHRAALAVRQTLTRDDPLNPGWRRAVGISLNNLGDLDTDAGRLDAAAARFGESVATHERLARDHPAVIEYRNGLAFALTGLGRAHRRAGRPAEAVAPLRRAVALREAIPNLPLGGRYDLARDHALLAAAAADPASGLSAAEGGAEADRAMAALRGAVAAGYRNLAAMRTDTDLDPLRGRDDFRLLMMDLAMPADPFAAAR